MPNINHTVVVAMNSKSFAPPSMAPRHSGYYNGIQFFPFDVYGQYVGYAKGMSANFLPIGPVVDGA